MVMVKFMMTLIDDADDADDADDGADADADDADNTDADQVSACVWKTCQKGEGITCRHGHQ